MSIATTSAPVQRETHSRSCRPLVAPDVLRDVIEILQLGGKSAPITVLEVAGVTAATADQVVKDLGKFATDDMVVGWLDCQRLGIVLPHTTAFNAQLIVESARQHGRLVDWPISFWTSETHGETDARPLSALYVRATPAWKRCLDIAGASIGLVLAAPVILLAAVAIRLTTGGPAFFRQQRVGLGGVHFAIYKLRTMREDAEELKDELIEHNEQSGPAFKIKDDPRVTQVGSWLRRFSIDELPQLVNVLKGDMSLVGPRPLPTRDWHPMVSWHGRRHDVKPGLTCIWQISGRSEVDFDKWVKMDLEYIEIQGVWTDFWILVHTIPAVLGQTGAA